MELRTYAELQMKHTISHWSRIIMFLHELVYMYEHTHTRTQVPNIVLHWTFRADFVPLWATCGLRCLCHFSCG